MEEGHSKSEGKLKVYRAHKHISSAELMVDDLASHVLIIRDGAQTAEIRLGHEACKCLCKVFEMFGIDNGVYSGDIPDKD